VDVEVEWTGAELHGRVGEHIIETTVTRLIGSNSSNPKSGNARVDEFGRNVISRCFHVPFTILDTDECLLPPNHSMRHVCPPSSICINTNGSYDCGCPRLLGSNDSDAVYGESFEHISGGPALPTRDKITLLCVELLFGLFGVDRLFLGSWRSGLIKLIVSFSAAWFAVRKGCGTFNTLVVAWGPWGAADLAMILLNALQRESSIHRLGMYSVFEPSSLEAAGQFGVFVAVLYVYVLCRALSLHRPEAKIGFGVPPADSFGVGGVLQTEQGDQHDVVEEIDGDVLGSTFAVPGTTAEVIFHATATLTQQAVGVNDPECPADTSCVVCCETIEEGDNVRVLPCLHRFHVSCVDKWLVRSRTCPVCKQDITG